MLDDYPGFQSLKTNRLAKHAILALSVTLVPVLALLDYMTGEELDFFVLYFLPIALAAWHAGRRAGIAMAVASALAWLEIDHLARMSIPWALEAWDTAIRLIAFLTVALALAAIREALQRQQKLNDELSEAMAQIKQLRGILPICSFCKKIRDTGERWVSLERYISDHSEAQLSHGLCPSCFKKYYSEADGT